MELNFITTAAYILSGLFIILLIRTYRPSVVKRMWQNAKKNQEVKKSIIDAEKKGLKLFEFENGKYLIPSKTFSGANFEYKRQKAIEKRQAKLKKV